MSLKKSRLLRALAFDARATEFISVLRRPLKTFLYKMSGRCFCWRRWQRPASLLRFWTIEAIATGKQRRGHWFVELCVGCSLQLAAAGVLFALGRLTQRSVYLSPICKSGGQKWQERAE